MAIHTYGALAEEIITEYYKKQRNDNAGYTIRHIAEQIAQEVAFFAKADAYEQSHMGESTYANDMFITPYWGLTLLTNSSTGDKYVPMPNVPSGLPQGRELAYVGFTGNKKVQVFPMRNKDRFMQSFVNSPKWMVLAYIEGENICFDNLSTMVTATVDIKLVGAAPAGELVNMPLNIPKSTQGMIFDKILLRMNQIRGVLPDYVNDGVSR